MIDNNQIGAGKSDKLSPYDMDACIHITPMKLDGSLDQLSYSFKMLKQYGSKLKPDEYASQIGFISKIENDFSENEF